MAKEITLQKIKENGVIAVIRGSDKQQAIDIVSSCIQAGLFGIELTFTTPLAHKVLEHFYEQNDSNILLGAGTVLDSETARIAILCGASYIVSPHFDENVALMCNRYDIPYIAGCMTIKEIVHALSFGVSIIKAFPGENLKPIFLKNVKGPIPHAKIIPTGGVDLNNMKEWFDAGAYAVGIGSALTAPLKKNPQDFQGIKNIAKLYIEKYNEIKTINKK